MVDRSETLKLSGIDEAYASYYPVTWQSSDKRLATVNSGVVTGIAKGKVTGYKNSIIEIYTSGKVKAIGAGTTTLKGTDKNNKNVTLKINVNPISTRSAVYINKGKKATITFPKVNAAKAKWFLDGKETTNNGILEINSKGRVKALKAGSSVVSCIYEGFTFRTSVFVEEPSLMTDSYLVSNGKKWNLNIKKGNVYTITTSGTYQLPIWTSKLKEVAFVDENGTVYPRKAGKTVISTKLNGKTMKISVTVSE